MNGLLITARIRIYKKIVLYKVKRKVYETDLNLIDYLVVLANAHAHVLCV